MKNKEAWQLQQEQDAIRQRLNNRGDHVKKALNHANKR